VSARKQRSLEDSSRARAAEEELQSFSYIVSHDLAASLRHLSIFSGMLIEERGEEATENERRIGGRIREAGANCHSMLEQLRAYASVQRKALQTINQDATPIVRLVALRASAQARPAGAEIIVEPLGEVFADGELLAQAFAALIDNAIKFARPDTPPRIAVTPSHDDAFWRARISDNGIGVEPELREAAFQMFRRLHGQSAYPGAGAGLAIVRRIARRHGGEARFLDSAEGARVELALPRAARATKRPRDPRGDRR
jgi:light-regulated signal transduction histidine kinase (bacteriophytochrome)